MRRRGGIRAFEGRALGTLRGGIALARAASHAGAWPPRAPRRPRGPRRPRRWSGEAARPRPARAAAESGAADPARRRRAAERSEVLQSCPHGRARSACARAAAAWPVEGRRVRDRFRRDTPRIADVFDGRRDAKRARLLRLQAQADCKMAASAYGQERVEHFYSVECFLSPKTICLYTLVARNFETMSSYTPTLVA